MPKPLEHYAMSSETHMESKEGRGCVRMGQCPLSLGRAAVIVIFFYISKVRFQGVLWLIMLEKFDIWDKLQTFNVVKIPHYELPLCHVANHISFPSPINIHLVLYHKKFVQLSGIFWKCLIISSLHLFIHVVILFPFVSHSLILFFIWVKRMFIFKR